MSASTHCARLALLNTESAATLRELAAHHERLALGTPSTAPADHRALAEYFLTVAAGHTAEADAHGRMAQAYRGTANRRGGDPAAHCDRLVTLARDAAAEARAAATEHSQLADID